MKKTYIEPNVEVIMMKTQGFLALSKFDPSEDTESIVPSSEEFGGEFSAPTMSVLDSF